MQYFCALNKGNVGKKYVKKVRVLTIRRLTRHIGKLKLKKGSEDLVLKNQKRAERLIEEIHAMKVIPYINPKSTATERAIARLATHPVLKSKIAELKAAVKAFKDARKAQAKTQLSVKDKSEEHSKSADLNSNVDDQVLKAFQKQQEYEDKVKISMKLGTATEKELCESEYEQKIGESEKACTPKEVSLQAAEGQAVARSKVGNKFDYSKRKQPKSISKFTATKESVSDVSDGEQHEKEYFDDSTEERFYNQSSDSDSDSNDDFFIGKVKRKKKIAAASGLSSVKGKNRPQKTVLKKEKNTMPRTVQDLIGEEGKLQAKTTKLESVFCSSLSTSNQKPQNISRNHKGQSFPKKEPQIKKHQFDKVAGIKCKNKKACLDQPLHPSWEASKKRREQMSQITAFQGKKIKFDD
uniref:Serum response factor-binding protein 1 n=1 Tax=Nothoprocta perdicaria TaxID=30464 RepID=A0A8C7A4N8_NOTPE